MKIYTYLLLPLFAGIVSGSFACTTESYCFDCEHAAAGAAGSSGSPGTGGSGASGVLDASFDNVFIDSNSCNADLDNDPLNCGFCGHVCEIPNAYAMCKDKFCVIDRCASGYYDINGKVEDGCEYECEPLRDTQGNPVTEETLCNGIDDDCDGLIDEVFDLESDAQHCGGCNQACQAPANAIMKCVKGKCEFDSCFVGYEDVNGDIGNDPTDGCECNFLGIEECNYNDDDCDGEVDEGFDLTSDVNNCGACQYACGDLYPHAKTICENGACAFGGCLPGFHDVDGLLATGCEYECTPGNPAVEACNGIDDDCNGFVDDGVLPGVGESCGSNVGACKFGKQQCVGGSLICVGDTKPSTELCDGIDNDCNGKTDEICPTAKSPVRLDVGGSAQGQHSTTQLSMATQGDATFAAYLDRRMASNGADIRLNYTLTANGAWLTSDMVVAGTAASEVEPWVFTSPTKLYVAYELFIAGDVRRIQLARTGISPTTWTTIQAEKALRPHRIPFMFAVSWRVKPREPTKSCWYGRRFKARIVTFTCRRPTMVA
ncbi:MAG TPA: MopE-related protein [Polyangiaceae bacterium]|nr:MopE-related protein [Polyangiaceae bacterium]